MRVNYRISKFVVVCVRQLMGDSKKALVSSSNMLVPPVGNDSQSDQDQYPDMGAERDDLENGDSCAPACLTGSIIVRNGHHSPAELQKGLTVFTAAVFIIGEMAGSGILALPAAIVGAGWTGFALLVLCCFASGYCGTVLGRSWAILRDRHDEYKGHVRYPYPAIGEKAYGRWASIAVTVCINITLIGSV